MLFAAQIKAGRSIIKMSQLELAELTGLSIGTIKKLENHEEAVRSATLKTITKIKEALEDHGVKFLYPKEKGTMSGVGVRYYETNDEVK